MSTQATQSNVSQTPAQSFAALIKEDFFMVLSGACTTKPDYKEFASKKGGSPYRFMTFEVTSGDTSHLCKIVGEDGQDYPDIQFFTKYRFLIIGINHDDFNGVTLDVKVIEKF